MVSGDIVHHLVKQEVVYALQSKKASAEKKVAKEHEKAQKADSSSH